MARDPDYATAEREYRAALREQRELYLITLDGVLRALHEVARHGGDAVPAARADAEHVVRLVDERHLARVCEARASFDAAARPAERDVVVGHLAGRGRGRSGVGAGRRGWPRRRTVHVLRLFAVPLRPS